MDYIMMGFLKKEIFDGLHKRFLEAKFTKIPFLEILPLINPTKLPFLEILINYVIHQIFLFWKINHLSI